MPVPKKRTTSTSEATKVESSDHTMPDAQEFRHHLRTLAARAMRVVIEEVMREELEQFLGAAWGELTPERKGYRNGTYTRDLATSSGPIQDLDVPRDREGNFHTQVFDRYNRYEAQVAEGLTEMFVAGVSTQKVGDVAQTLMGVAPSASAVSRLNQTLTQQCGNVARATSARTLAHRVPGWGVLHGTPRRSNRFDGFADRSRR
jgi:putative transposase